MTGEEVFIVGGANSAGQAAIHLAGFAKRVTLVVRAATLEAGMSHYLVQAVEATTIELGFSGAGKLVLIAEAGVEQLEPLVVAAREVVVNLVVRLDQFAGQ